jgi:hypothetical protein
MLLLWGVAHNRTHTMGVYGNYEREREREEEERERERECRDEM